MNYYGTRRRGHDLAFHSELQDALFASGLPFVLSINDVPEAWELYSRAGSITRLCSAAGSALGQSCVWRRIEAAILCPTQDCQARTRPNQARTRPARPMVTWLGRWSPERRFGGSNLGGLTC